MYICLRQSTTEGIALIAWRLSQLRHAFTLSYNFHCFVFFIQDELERRIKNRTVFIHMATSMHQNHLSCNKYQMRIHPTRGIRNLLGKCESVSTVPKFNNSHYKQCCESISLIKWKINRKLNPNKILNLWCLRVFTEARMVKTP